MIWACDSAPVSDELLSMRASQLPLAIALIAAITLVMVG